MYDWAHTLSDYIEGITHSVCTLEFEVHRPLYNWILEALELREPRPHQYEFARLNLTYSVMSKRKLIQLVNEKLDQFAFETIRGCLLFPDCGDAETPQARCARSLTT